MERIKINACTFRFVRADDEKSAQRAAIFSSLLDQQAEVLARMNQEIRAGRAHYEQYCRAIEGRNQELADQDEVIDALRQRCRKEARHKICWMAAAVLMVVFYVLGAVALLITKARW